VGHWARHWHPKAWWPQHWRQQGEQPPQPTERSEWIVGARWLDVPGGLWGAIAGWRWLSIGRRKVEPVTEAAALPVRFKTANEQRTLSFDCGSKLPNGQSGLSSATVTAESGLTAGAAAINGRIVSARVSGGEDGADYVVTAEAVAANGDTVSLSVVVSVRDDTNS
jgi:hypothetical protein